MLTAVQKKTAYSIVEGTPRAVSLVRNPEHRRRLADITLECAEKEFIERGEDAQKWRVVYRVAGDPEVKTFFTITFFLTVLVGWAIGKLLDYYWDNWSE